MQCVAWHRLTNLPTAGSRLPPGSDGPRWAAVQQDYGADGDDEEERVCVANLTIARLGPRRKMNSVWVSATHLGGKQRPPRPSTVTALGLSAYAESAGDCGKSPALGTRVYAPQRPGACDVATEGTEPEGGSSEPSHIRRTSTRSLRLGAVRPQLQTGGR